ncbi:MAG TPA: hypothetical protein VHH36_01745 [Candidatus Thermoplasmatota archaeon]|nr:hypothetical protein [Candidatus Thermoplasmatota archaeon]
MSRPIALLLVALAAFTPASAAPAPCASPAPGVALCDADRDGLADDATVGAAVAAPGVALASAASSAHANRTKDGGNVSGHVLVPGQASGSFGLHRTPGKRGDNTTFEANAFNFFSPLLRLNGVEVDHHCEGRATSRGVPECAVTRSHVGATSGLAGRSQGVGISRAGGLWCATLVGLGSGRSCADVRLGMPP